MAYQITRRKSVTSITFQVGADWEQWFLLQSDIHWDSPQCNRDLLDRHLREMKKKNALGMIFGDLVDCMQGKYDPRRSYDNLRPEFKVDNYFDAIVDESSKYLLPYKDNIVMLADGNHEKSVEKNSGTNILDRVVDRLRQAGGNVGHGGYGGWINLNFQIAGVNVDVMRIKYNHGSGGEAPVTKGTIQTNRQAVVYGNADLIINGHSHHNYYLAIAKEMLNTHGNVEFGLQHFIRIPGYHQSYGDGSTGWEVERGMVPKAIGAAWMYLQYDSHRKKIIPKFVMDIQAPDAE